MKVYEMNNLYVGYNKTEDFRILICAFDMQEADEVLKSYALDSHLEGDWEITKFQNSEVKFNVDYVITNGF